MSLKKKSGEKLAQGVRQVQAQRESVPAAPVEPVVADPAIESTPAEAAARPSAPRTAQPTVKKPTVKPTVKNTLHPKRVWPD